MNIFEELDRLLRPIYEASESDVSAAASEKAERIVKSIPVNPEMETKEQGMQKAWEKLAKYFYKLQMGNSGFGGGLSRNDEIDLPDDFLAPEMKGKMSGKIQDKEFEANKVIWDPEEEMEKLKKEIDVNMQGSDDDFDDFDYRDNDFGDDADMDDVDTDDLDSSGSGGSGDDSDKSEDEKLKDAIDDALDKLSDNGLDDDGNDGQQDGQQQGGQQGGQQQSGQQGGQQSGGQQGGQQSGGQQQGGQQGGQQQGEQAGAQQQGHQPGSQDGKGGQNSSGSEQTEQSGSNSDGSTTRGNVPKTRKDQKLKEIKDALERKDGDGVKQAMDDIKEGEDGSGKLAGQNIGQVSDKDLKGDMSKAGISQKDIEEMSKASKENKTKDIDEEEMREMKKRVVDGLEDKCKKKGGSALAKTIVRNALRSKINDDEWRSMLKLFLKSKAVNNGDMSKTKSGTKYGHKNHLWRDAVLPTKTTARGQVQTIYCFVDFSGSVNQDLVYTFLGRVIDLCAELNYTNIVVYGFGAHIVLPREINGRMIKKDGRDVVLAQTWDYISSQNPGASTENFRDVAEEIMEIRKRQRDAVYLIFGDAFWGDPDDGPMCLNTICGERLLDRMCVLTYYTADTPYEIFAGFISMLKDLVKLKNVITTKAQHIRE